MKKKNNYVAGNSLIDYWFQILRTMKIFIFLMFLTVSGICANTYSQNTKFTLNLKQVTVKEVFEQIQNQSEFVVFYKDSQVDLNRKVDVVVEDSEVNQILDVTFAGTNLSYKILDRQIIIKPKEVESKPKKNLDIPESENQQKKTIKGKVTDSEGEALPGVSIIVKGTTIGITSDFEGNYILEIPNDAKTLVFSFVGMNAQEVNIGEQTQINVTLEENNVSLEEVVAVGYGTMKRADLTGAVVSVQSRDLVKAPVKSFDEAMAGRVAGVQITSGDGQPGSLPSIVIRGANSLTSDNSPLYVIDGFPIEGNDENFALNPADIESIDILKDASATAIYGARGANGVIMITTKRGKAGKPKITYTGYYGFQNEVKRMEVMGPYDFVRMLYDRNPDETEQRYLSGRNKTLEDYKNDKGIDWYDEVVHYAPMQNHSISASGGTTGSKYFVSGSYFDQKGIFLNTGFNRYQGRIALDQTINKKASFGINANYSESKSYGAVASSGNGSLGFMYSLWAYRPVEFEDSRLIDEIYDPEVNTLTDYRTNPILALKNTHREVFNGSLTTNANFTYEIAKGLILRVDGGFRKYNYQLDVFNNSQTSTGNPESPNYKGINGTQTMARYINFSNSNTLSWNKKINAHHKINLMAGFTQGSGENKTFGAEALMISNEDLGMSGLDNGTPSQIIANQTKWVQQSFFTRANYDYKSKYLFTFTMRADGSSRFAEENRWGYFPSAALAYRLSSEEFMKELTFVSNAKLRVSYGATGNNRIGDFATLSSMNQTIMTGYPFGNTKADPGLYSSTLGNHGLKWETTTQFDIGADIAFFDNRLSVTADYYSKKTKDLLLYAQLPYTTGYGSAYKNIGAISNKGFELAINTVNIEKRNFTWSSDFNISFNRNKILALVDGQEAMTTNMGTVAILPLYIAKVGYPVAMFYGPIAEGLYQYDDFNVLDDGTYILKDGLPTNGNTNRELIQPGYAKYRDINNDGQIDLNDYTFIGDPNPDFIGGFNNSFKFKGFDLSVLLQFSYGNDVMNANKIVFEGGSDFQYSTNAFTSYNDRWSPDNTDTEIPVPGGHGFGFYSSRYIEDASFLRLKTISLGYSLNKNLLRTAGISSLRFYVSGQNLYTLSNYSGIDPEVSTRHSSLTPGLDYSPYPRMKTFTFGVELTF